MLVSEIARVHCAVHWSSKRCVTYFVFCSAFLRAPRWYALTPRARQYACKSRICVKTPKWPDEQRSKAKTIPTLSRRKGCLMLPPCCVRAQLHMLSTMPRGLKAWRYLRQHVTFLLFFKKKKQYSQSREFKCSGASTSTCGVLGGGLQDFSSPSTPRRAHPKEITRRSAASASVRVVSHQRHLVKQLSISLIRERAVCFQ